MKILTVSAALLSIAFAAPAFAQSAAGEPGTVPGNDTTTTHEAGQTGMTADNGDLRSLLGQLVQANQMEIQMGKLALDNSKSKTVKAFAKKLVADHTAAAEKVKPIAQAKGVEMPMSMGDEKAGDQKMGADKMGGMAAGMSGDADANVDKLQSLKGAEFDREFASIMVDGHQKAISLLDQIKVAAAGDKQIVDLVNQLHPTIEKHLAAAKALVKEVGSPRHETRGTDVGHDADDKNTTK